MIKKIIFDLDGTLLDTSEGIINSVRYAESELNLSALPASELREFIGPPPFEMYKKKYNLSEIDAMRATEKHREYGKKKAIFEAKLYPGIVELLLRLKELKISLCVATLKAQSIAEMILEEYGIKIYFDCIVGMDTKESFSKCKTIQLAMGDSSRNTVLMVGDSFNDLSGAVEAGVRFVGVTYGWGFNNETEMTFPKIDCPLELLNLL